METKEQRQKRIKKMLDAGIANYEAYIKQLEDVIDSKTYTEAVEYYENLSDSNKLYATILQTYKMMLSIYQSGLESENENDKKLKSAIDEIMRKMTAEEATEKGKKLADDVETLQKIQKRMAELTDSYVRYTDLVRAESKKKHSICSKECEKYRKLLESVPEEERNEFILEDLQIALELIRDSNKYTDKLASDIKTAKATLHQKYYARVVYGKELNKEQSEQLDIYTRICSIVEIYVYPFLNTYGMLNLYETDENKIGKTQHLTNTYNAIFLEKITKKQADRSKELLELESIFNGNSFPIPYFKPLNVLTAVSGSRAKTDNMGLDYTLETERYKVTRKIIESNKIVKSYGVLTDKLFRSLLGEFMRVNSRTAEPKNINTHIELDMFEYAKAIGYNLTEEVKESHEEQEKERKKFLQKKKDFRKSIIECLENISGESIRYTDKKLKETGKFIIIEGYKVSGKTGKIEVTMGQTFSQEILNIRTPLTKQHTCLLKIDGNNQTAYQVGIKLQSHYNMYPNVNNGTYDIISIKSLLESTSLPSIEDLKEKAIASKWAERIKAPLENALDYLHSKGAGICFLKDYYYSHAKHEPLSDKEEADIINDSSNKCDMSFDEWKELYIVFKIEEPEENTQQRVIDAKARKQRKKKKDAVKTKKKGEKKK